MPIKITGPGKTEVNEINEDLLMQQFTFLERQTINKEQKQEISKTRIPETRKYHWESYCKLGHQEIGRAHV